MCFNRNQKFNIVYTGSKILLVYANFTFKFKKLNQNFWNSIS